ncbi:MAG: hypothetical protein ACPIOQ_56130 [Promethearchaeia archaeon]
MLLPRPLLRTDSISCAVCCVSQLGQAQEQQQPPQDPSQLSPPDDHMSTPKKMAPVSDGDGEAFELEGGDTLSSSIHPSRTPESIPQGYRKPTGGSQDTLHLHDAELELLLEQFGLRPATPSFKPSLMHPAGYINLKGTASSSPVATSSPSTAEVPVCMHVC